jgi:8-amino-7-oxononanoate synthase
MRRAHLHALIHQLDESLHIPRWTRLPSQTAIQPIVIGENAEALGIAAALDRRGLWVPAIRPPTVAEHTARLRVTLSASHTAEDVAQLSNALNALHAGER